MIEVRRPDAFRTDQPGIASRHVFSSGPHYDPDNVAVGPVIGCDEHLVEPGAGFDWHRHRGVVIVSWVLAGRLRHEGTNGEMRVLGPGAVLVQSAGPGIRHAETNASPTRPLRFVQTTLLVESEPAVWIAEPPVGLPGGAVFRVESSVPDHGDGLAVAIEGVPDVLVVQFAD